MVMLLAFVLACRTVPVTEGRYRGDTVYCFDGRVRVEGEMQTATGCFTTDKLCKKALDTAQRYGRMAGVEGLTECSKR